MVLRVHPLLDSAPWVRAGAADCISIAAALAPNMPARVLGALGATRALQPASTLRALPGGLGSAGVSAAVAFAEQRVPGLIRLHEVRPWRPPLLLQGRCLRMHVFGGAATPVHGALRMLYTICSLGSGDCCCCKYTYAGIALWCAGTRHC